MTEYKVELHFSLAADIDIHQVAIWLHRVVQTAGGMLVGVVKVIKEQKKN